MPRYTITTENKRKPDGRKLNPGALGWGDDRVEVTSVDGMLLDYATNLHRESNGEITAEFNSPIDLDLYEINICMNRVVVMNDNIKSGNLRGITLVPIPTVQF